MSLWTVNEWLWDPQQMEKLADGAFRVHLDRMQWGGAGVLLWPGKDRILDSVRWELIREGIEDYEYLYQLRALLSNAALAGELKDKVQQETDAIEKTLRAGPPDADRLAQLREKVGSLLESCTRKAGN
jgi:hypothetical protein